MTAEAPLCPACGHEGASQAFTGEDWALRAAPGTFTMWRCARCSSAWQFPQPDDATLTAAYASTYGNYEDRRSLIERLAEPLARREAARLVRSADHTAPLVEIGCGTGRFLERLRTSGWTGPMRGAEPEAEVAASTARRLGLQVDAAMAEDVALEDSSVGTIVLRHVIEHVRDPGAVLERLRRALVPGGTLYIGTPDTRALAARAFGPYWWGWELPRHLVVFSAPGLRSLLRARGFDVEGEWWSFAPQMWCASAWIALDRGRHRPWTRAATSLANPLATAPAAALAGAEVAARRGTMYAALARRPLA